MVKPFLKFEWDLLRGQLIFTLVSLLIAAAIVYVTYDYMSDSGKQYIRERTQLNEVIRKYKAAVTDESIYKQYVTAFQAYESRNIIGEENRLLWIETLQKINTELQLPVFKYEIKPRQDFTLDSDQNDREQGLLTYESVMRLTLGLLHEGDLFEMLNRLRKANVGLFEVRSCAITRNNHENNLNFDGSTPNFSADCFISWYTIILDQKK